MNAPEHIQGLSLDEIQAERERHGYETFTQEEQVRQYLKLEEDEEVVPIEVPIRITQEEGRPVTDHDGKPVKGRKVFGMPNVSPERFEEIFGKKNPPKE